MTLRPRRNRSYLIMLLWYSFLIVTIISGALLARDYHLPDNLFINPALALLLFTHFTVLVG